MRSAELNAPRSAQTVWNERCPARLASCDSSRALHSQSVDDYQLTGLWARSLAPRDADLFSSAREALRAAYVGFRQRAGLLAAEIARDLPDYTVHDLTHLDALWTTADVVAGPEFELTPPEAFVFGGAVLTHDLAMSRAAATVCGPLQEDVRWLDALAAELRLRLRRPPTPTELQAPPPEVEEAVNQLILRELHAEHAALLTTAAWRDRSSDAQYWLIDDVELRSTFGNLIGQIAESHWWPAHSLGERFPTRLGAPSRLPRAWEVDPLRVACLLRLADAAHIDTRRAPGFLRALRAPKADSRAHWIFQERMNQPFLEEDRLMFTAHAPFPTSDVDAWWVCFDTLRMIDGELRAVDNLLADVQRPRFAARSVGHVETPDRLTVLVPAQGWRPVDARVHVSDVASLVETLGGVELYGRAPHVAVRELVQNGADATRALLALTSVFQPSVSVRLEQQEADWWLSVRDRGIGMAPSVMTGPLLGFGKSYWSSTIMRQQFPGLLSSNFRSTGSFGIGFFSVFMAGKEVRVTSRRYDAARRDTYVLEFGQEGLSTRPILREAGQDERLPHGGTEITVKLGTDPTGTNGLLYVGPDEVPYSLPELCKKLFPAIDVTIQVVSDDDEAHTVVDANDWIALTTDALLARILVTDVSVVQQDAALRAIANRMRSLQVPGGEIVGRAAIVGSRFSSHPLRGRLSSKVGIVTIGGAAAAELFGIAGIFVGEPIGAARDLALPIVPYEILAAWATEQATLLGHIERTPHEQSDLADIVIACGGDPGPLKVARLGNDWCTHEELRNRLTNLRRVRVCWGFTAETIEGSGLAVDLDDDVLVIMGGLHNIIAGRSRWIAWPRNLSSSVTNGRDEMRSVDWAVWRAISEVWGWGEAFPELGRYRQGGPAVIGRAVGQPIEEDHVVELLRDSPPVNEMG